MVDTESLAESLPGSPRPLWTELFVAPEMLVSVPTIPFAAAIAPNASARPVLVIPGFTAGDVTTIPIRAFLRSQGHRPYGWGLGLNVGLAEHIAVGLDRTLQELAHRHGTEIDIVGWSAGGLLARVLAQHRSELVGQVISLGSPIRLHGSEHNIGMIAAIVSKLFVASPAHIDVDQVPVPSTTVWTEDDGVVPGEQCRQTVDERSEAIQVRGTHCGLGTNPAVMYVLANRLAQQPGTWSPFEPPAALRWLYPSIDNADHPHNPDRADGSHDADNPNSSNDPNDPNEVEEHASAVPA